MTPRPTKPPREEKQEGARVPVGEGQQQGPRVLVGAGGVSGAGVAPAKGSPVAANGRPAPANGSPAPTAERVGAWVKEFALYPFFNVLGVVGVFTLLSLLLRNDETPMDFLQQVRSGRGNDRWYAAYQLSNLIGRKGDELKLDPVFVTEVRDIFAASDDEDPRLQRYLVMVLGRVGDGAAVPVLTRALAADDDTETRMGAAWALGALGRPEGVPALLAALEDTEPGVRTVAAYALGSLKAPSAAEPLRQRLEDPAADVRWNAALALAQLGDPAGFPVLRDMVNLATLSRVEGMTDEHIKEAMLNAVKALGMLQTVSPSARDVLAETSRAAPFPLVQQEARSQLEKAAAPATTP